MAEGVWHEFHCGIYAGDVRELQLHRPLPLSRAGTIHGSILSGMDYRKQCRDGVPHPLVDVSETDFFESITKKH